MRIIIGIPSLNEAKTISYVTRQADEGLVMLSRKFQLKEPLIINADSRSRDKTRSVFLQTTTQAKKISLQPEGKIGKGTNVLALLEAAIASKADALILLDSDVRSITPEWIELFLEPILLGHADFVSPIYARNRFEGSTTNHFAFPLLWGYFGNPIRQPIAGDFALGRNLVEFLVKQSYTPEVIGYGIDIFLSIHAAASEFRVHQVPLGFKKHKPSFSKIENIFSEVAASAVKLLDVYPPRPPIRPMPTMPCAIDDTQPFAHEQEAQELFKKARVNAIALLPTYGRWVSASKQDVLDKEIRSHFPIFSARSWSELLAGYLLSAGSSEQLLPAFICRTVAFWNKSNKMIATNIETELIGQADLFREALLRRLMDKR